MTRPPESRAAFLANTEFSDKFRKRLTSRTSNMRNLRVLDFGAGAIPRLTSTFTALQPDQLPVTAYDPHLDLSLLPQTDRSQASDLWVSDMPEGQFDLLVCNFSLHHMEGSLAERIRDLTERFNPRLFAIADYNYEDIPEAQFLETFSSEQEQAELRNLFGGNVQNAYAYHSRLMEPDFINVLENNGYVVRQDDIHEGFGAAASKFFVIGERRGLGV